MIIPHSYRGQTIAVFGLGRTGVSSALALKKAGATVLGWDDRDSARLDALKAGVDIQDLRELDWADCDALLLSPGVPHELPEPHWTAVKARAADVPIICDVEIFAREMVARDHSPHIVAITGTNGKSTTTALTGHILNHAGRHAHIGGNIGRGVLDLPEPDRDTIYVLELSSYQLERAPSLHANVAMLINLSPDHLERHGDMAGYEAAKRRIFANQTPSDTAVLGADDAVGKRLYSEMKLRKTQRVVPVTTRSSTGGGVNVISGLLVDRMGVKSERVTDLSTIQTLPGIHNHQNAAMAYAACRALGLSSKTIASGLHSFPGLAHRMEIVGRAGSVRFVNDSKATNAEAALQALRSYDSIYWIAGGLAKAGGIDSLAPVFDPVEKAYLIGTAASEFARTLSDAKVDHVIAKELDAAVKAAACDAFKSGRETVVLLSPACASFDQFKDFEARGDAFRASVSKILALYASEIARAG